MRAYFKEHIVPTLIMMVLYLMLPMKIL